MSGNSRTSRREPSGEGGRVGPIRRTRLTLGALVAVGTLVVLAACTAAPPSSPTFIVPLPHAELSFSYEADAVDVLPGEAVVVTVEGGTLQSVSLTCPQAQCRNSVDREGDSTDPEVRGEISADGTTWTSTDDLMYAKTYTFEVSSVGEDGEVVAETRSFTTFTIPANDGFAVSLRTTTGDRADYVGTERYTGPLDGGTFGVGQVVVARFNEPVEKAKAEAALTVTTVPAMDGVWSWRNEYEVHWRPTPVAGQPVYWPAHTEVVIEANILGLTAQARGRTVYGRENVRAAFTIGESRVAKVDNNTHQMQVFIEGALVKTIPVSMGRDGVYAPDHWYNPETGITDYYRTYSGIMVVTERHTMFHMSGTDAGGEWEEDIPNALRITDSGVFVHSAPWSVWAQGSRNVSHGCVNVSPANAQWFYDTFRPGDVVEIANTGRNLYPNYHPWNGVTDWNMPWETWLAGSALPHSPDPTPAPSATPSAA